MRKLGVDKRQGVDILNNIVLKSNRKRRAGKLGLQRVAAAQRLLRKKSSVRFIQSHSLWHYTSFSQAVAQTWTGGHRAFIVFTITLPVLRCCGLDINSIT